MIPAVNPAPARNYTCCECRASFVLNDIVRAGNNQRCKPCALRCGCDTPEHAEQGGSLVIIWIVASVLLALGILWDLAE